MRAVSCLLTLMLPAVAMAAEPAGVVVRVAKDHIDFLAGNELIGTYHIGPEVAKPYLWPLNGPGGVPVTRAWPMVKDQQPGGSADHVHQKSVWFCHGDVIPDGVTLKSKIKDVDGVDFWSETRGHGVIACVKVEEPKQDKNHGQITTRNEWRTSDGIKIMDETRTLHFLDFGASRLFVFDIDLHASVCPITFGDTKEGAFGARVHDAIREEITVNRKKEKGPGTIQNADGKVGEKNVWGYPSPWCDYWGPIEGKQVGLALFADPSNPYPSCWHTRGYGLTAANPFGRAKSGFPTMKGREDLVKLAKGDHLRLRFGLLVHPGDTEDGKVAELFDRFVKLREGGR